MTNAGNSTPRSGAAERVKDPGAQAADSAEQAGQQAITSRPFKVLLTVGLIAYGVVHILIGWIALQIAWIGRGQGQEASQKGALAEMAQQPFGVVLLWITVVGLFALAVWQLIEAIWGIAIDRQDSNASASGWDRWAGPSRTRSSRSPGSRRCAEPLAPVTAARRVGPPA